MCTLSDEAGAAEQWRQNSPSPWNGHSDDSEPEYASLSIGSGALQRLSQKAPDAVEKSMTRGGLIPDLVLRATEGTSRRWTADARHTRPFSQKGSRGVDNSLAEPDPPSKNGIRMGGPGSDLMGDYQGSSLHLLYTFVLTCVRTSLRHRPPTIIDL